jgi:hypothetical protein
MRKKLKEGGTHPGTDREANCAHQDCLQQDHSCDSLIRDSDCFQSTELLEVFNGEDIKGLSGYYGSPR